MAQDSERLPYRPSFSVVMPVYNAPASFLQDALESVRQQAYPYWELCIADDASTAPHVRPMLDEYCAKDPRIKVRYRERNGHIAEASNSALELANGEFVTFMDHDDALAPHALFALVSVLNADPKLDLLYSDEDKIDRRGRRSEPTFKGGWAPDYFLSFMYLGHVAVYRRSLVMELGGFRAGFEGSQDYDLALRVTERTGRIRHIPEILYHWRRHPDSVAANVEAKPYAFRAARRALAEALERRGCAGAVIAETARRGIYRPVLRAATGTIAVFVDGDDERQLQGLDGCLAPTVSVRGGDRAGGAAFWRSALAACQADFVVLVNGGVWPSSSGWFNSLLEQLGRAEVGVVGAKIISSSGKIVHGGYTVCGSRATHNFYGLSAAAPGYAARLVTLQNVSAVSSLCMALSRSLAMETKAFEEGYTSATACELDLCLSAARAGKRVLWTPFAECTLAGPLPPRIIDLSDFPADLEILERKHGLSSFRDPFYPGALDPGAVDFRTPAPR